MVVIILIILGFIVIYFLGGCKPTPNPNPDPNPDPEPEPEPIPDPTGWKWPQIDDTTQRWADYCNYMQKMTSDTLVALEMRFYKWISDWDLWNKSDHWALPDVVWVNKRDDCLEENTEILVKNGIKKIKDLKEGDLVLSYNYDLEKYEHRKVINVWDKGILDGYKIRLTNAHSIIATGDHRFYCRTSEDFPEKYEIKRFKDIDLNYWCKRQLHCVHLLPEGEIDINEDLAYLYGIYIAEGYVTEGHVSIAQDKKDIRIKIEQVFHSLNVPYSKSKRTKHAFYNILQSDIKNKLKEFGSNSFNKRLPEEVLNWNKKSLRKLIEGMLDGDGTDCTNYRYNFKNAKIRNDLWEYSTSSEQVAKMFNVIVRKVYGNCYYYKQLNHQGVGNKPIWRLRFNPYALYNKREIYKNISTVSVSHKYLEEIKNKHYYDIEVENNHNFILAESGIISHNCDGLARLSADMLGRFVKIPEVWWLEYYGYYRKYNNDGSYRVVAGGHAITVYKKDGRLLAFSNTSWWNKLNFQDFIEIGEQTFPEGIYQMRCRHWETGKLQWVERAKWGEILKGTNIFHRKLSKIRNIKKLSKRETGGRINGEIRRNITQIR